MARQLSCDVCGKPTDAIVDKMYLTPVRRGVKSDHKSYTHHLDVGSCCHEKVLKIFKWSPRLSMKEYSARRKNGQ